MFKIPFFSVVVDESVEESITSVNIHELVECFQTIRTVVNSFPSTTGILEIKDNKLIITIDWHDELLLGSLIPSSFQVLSSFQVHFSPTHITPCSRLSQSTCTTGTDSSPLTSLSFHQLKPSADSDVWVSQSPPEQAKRKLHGGEDDTPEIEELIVDAEGNDMPEFVIKTMKEFKKMKDDLAVID